MTTATMTTTQHAARLQGARPVLFATGIGLALNLILETVEAILLPEVRDALLFNIVAVTVWSAGGLAIGLLLVRMGRREGRRTVAAWVAAVFALLTAVSLWWCAVPASLAGAAFALASGGRGSLTAARVVAVVAFVTFVALSIGMFPFTEV